MRVVFSVLALSLSLGAFAAEPNNDPSLWISRLYLNNGIKVVLAPNAAAKTVQVRVRVDAGENQEAYGKGGTAHLLEHYVFIKASHNESDMTYLEEISEHGGDGNANTGSRATTFYATVPPQNTNWLISTYGKVLFNKEFNQADVDFAKKPVYLEIGRPTPQDYLDDWVHYLTPSWARAPYAWHSEFGLNLEHDSGSDRILTDRLTADDLREFYSTYYRPDNMTVFISGRFNSGEITATLLRVFGAQSERQGPSTREARPVAKLRSYKRAISTSGTPRIFIGTKVAEMSAQDETVLRIYMEYLSHRLMKQLRNTRGETYTVSTDYDLEQGFGFVGLDMEAPGDRYQQNLKFVRDLIDRETRKGQLQIADFNEALNYWQSGLQLTDGDSGSMMKLALLADRMDRDYGTKNEVTPAMLASQIDFATYQASLKRLFAENMQYEYLSQPPLFFRFEANVLMLLAFAAFLHLAHLVVARPFPHDRLRWVRKISHPPAYLIEFVTLWITISLSYLASSVLSNIWAQIPFLQSSILTSDYLRKVALVGVGVSFLVGALGLCGRKVMVVGGQLWIKSLSYRSWVYNLEDVVRIETCRPTQVLFSVWFWNQVGFTRMHFYDMCFWRKGVMIQFRDGRSIYLHMRAPEAAAQELRTFVSGPRLVIPFETKHKAA